MSGLKKESLEEEGVGQISDHDLADRKARAARSRVKAEREVKRAAKLLRHAPSIGEGTLLAMDLAEAARAKLALAVAAAGSARAQLLATSDRSARRALAQRLNLPAIRQAAKLAMEEVRKYEHRVDGQRTSQLDEHWLGETTAETISLGKGRGEVVTIGKVRVQFDSRDGLLALHKSGSLTIGELRQGVAFRYLYEGAQERSKSQLGERSGGGPRDLVRVGLFRAYAGVRLRLVEVAIAKAKGGERMLQLVRCIAGEGHPMSSIGGRGNARAAALKALRRGLGLAADVIVREGLANQDT